MWRTTLIGIFIISACSGPDTEWRPPQEGNPPPDPEPVAEDIECPPWAVAVPNDVVFWNVGSDPQFVFCLDAEPVTAGSYARCVAAGACQPGALAVDGDGDLIGSFGQPERASEPITMVRLEQAQDFCRFYGGWVPSEEETEFARSQAHGLTYDPRFFEWLAGEVDGRVTRGTFIGESTSHEWVPADSYSEATTFRCASRPGEVARYELYEDGDFPIPAVTVEAARSEQDGQDLARSVGGRAWAVSTEPEPSMDGVICSAAGPDCGQLGEELVCMSPESVSCGVPGCERCTDDSQCSVGERCEGVCLAIQCGSDGDCPHASLTCEENECRPRACQTDSQCADSYCVQGSCRAEPGFCGRGEVRLP
ncbi:MAG: SUMF1/EgtB/PvdO family nonheme iron enzyme [Myxococcales bacterium]|nr:SUMF1/EgtB/PvdO family nonheme iron enzyme [Myxococcales bacterium]